MNNGKKTIWIAMGLVALNSLTGCATSPWHETLMSNEQLIAADCQQLAVEQSRVDDNARHSAEASKGGAAGAVFLAVLEGMAASANKTTINTSNSAAMNSASLADENSKQAAQLDGRKNMISMLRGKKGCS